MFQNQTITVFNGSFPCLLSFDPEIIWLAFLAGGSGSAGLGHPKFFMKTDKTFRFSEFLPALKLMKEDTTGFIKIKEGKKRESVCGVLHHHSCVHLSYVVKFP